MAREASRDRNCIGYKESIVNWGAIEALGDIVGTFAVVVSLVYLATQLRQVNKISKAEAEREWFQSWHEITRNLGARAEVATLVRKGLHDYESLSLDERAQFHSHVCGIFDHTDLLRRLHEKGFVSNDLYESHLLICLAFISSTGGKQWWDDVSATLPVAPWLEKARAKMSKQISPITDWVSFLGNADDV